MMREQDIWLEKQKKLKKIKRNDSFEKFFFLKKKKIENFSKIEKTKQKHINK